MKLVGYNHFTKPQKEMVHRQVDMGSNVFLIPNPNKWDENAIEVHVGGTQVGWVDREQAAEHVKKLKAHMKLFDNSSVTGRVVTKNRGFSMNVWAEAEVTVSCLKRKPGKVEEWAPPFVAGLERGAKLGDKGGKYKLNSLVDKLEFGRHQGIKLMDIDDVGYVRWMFDQRIISEGLLGKWKAAMGIGSNMDEFFSPRL